MSTTIDEALELLEETGPEFIGGLSNHGPMAAEALFALGCDDAVIPWVERYKRRLLEHPEARNDISVEDWQEALGDGKRMGDWVAFFDRRLAEARWPDVLDTWVARLAPGLVAAATHGVIRTGHAVRSIASGETRARRHELAEGLGYWAARYQQLPDAAQTGGALLPSAAIRQVDPVPPDEQQPMGHITIGLTRLDEFEPFAAAAGLVDTSGDVSRFVSDLTETFAAVYLANAGSGRFIHFIHAVTAPSAARLLAPHLSPETTRLTLRYAWQAAAGLYTAFARKPEPVSVGPSEEDREDLIDRAVATGDEHAIKFTEACLREYDVNPRPVYLAAARDASERAAAR